MSQNQTESKPAENLERELATVTRERDEARGQRDELVKVIEAASVLIAAKGRHNTMLAYNGLRDALQTLTPNVKVEGPAGSATLNPHKPI